MDMFRLCIAKVQAVDVKNPTADPTDTLQLYNTPSLLLQSTITQNTQTGVKQSSSCINILITPSQSLHHARCSITMVTYLKQGRFASKNETMGVVKHYREHTQLRVGLQKVVLNYILRTWALPVQTVRTKHRPKGLQMRVILV